MGVARQRDCIYSATLLHISVNNASSGFPQLHNNAHKGSKIVLLLAWDNAIGNDKQSEDSRGPSFIRFRAFLVNSSGLLGSELLLEALVEGGRTFCVGKHRKRPINVLSCGPMASRNLLLQEKYFDQVSFLC
jgi:hypothetical protein